MGKIYFCKLMLISAVLGIFVISTSAQVEVNTTGNVGIGVHQMLHTSWV